MDQLRTEGKITSALVKAAFLTVRREHFLPEETPLETAYGFDSSVVTKRDEGGGALSSVSAAYIQARMLEQAGLSPGMSVLEIGSGGLNAALIAEIVGEQGHVVTVDIDPEVTDRATKLLDEAGYGSRVRVVAADAENGVPGRAEFNAIIVTVGAWDIAPAWLRQLAQNGTLVLPLVMNGVTRTVGLRRDGEHLTSTSIEVAGFVPMQGIGRHDERLFVLAGPDGKKITLRFDDGAPVTPAELDDVLASGPVENWSGVVFPPATSWADLYLWLAWYLPGFCRLVAEDSSALEKHGTWFPFGVVSGAGFAFFVTRTAPNGKGVEFGATAYGRDGELAAATLVEQIRAWDRDGRPVAGPSIGYWPTGSDLSKIPSDAAVMEKTHGVVTISWPPKG
ncbi:protein-L-isoaspartate(D-aspartate) O-methyltransferase [Actinoplanes lutulentus]|nr:protein-L-isoaspartate(D-aspartate) O-methyltransferase [Actinoplanes lutulentus]